MTEPFVAMLLPAQLLVAYNIIDTTACYVILGFIVAVAVLIALASLAVTCDKPLSDLAVYNSTSSAKLEPLSLKQASSSANELHNVHVAIAAGEMDPPANYKRPVKQSLQINGVASMAANGSLASAHLSELATEAETTSRRKKNLQM
jgi:hypothetical protein